MNQGTRKLYPNEYTEWQNNKTPENTTKLMNTMEYTINSGVKSYGGGDPKYKTKARILAMKAIESYDPSKDIQLNTHVMSQLRPLSRVRRDRSNMSHVPENVYFNQRTIKDARSDYYDQYDIDASDQTIADKTGITVKQIRAADKYNVGEVSSSMTTSEKGDSMVDKDRDYYDVWVDYVYHDLDDKDKKIFEGVSGHNGAAVRTKQEIAKDLKMTAPAVSYRISRITDRLAEMPQDEVG